MFKELSYHQKVNRQRNESFFIIFKALPEQCCDEILKLFVGEIDTFVNTFNSFPCYAMSSLLYNEFLCNFMFSNCHFVLKVFNSHGKVIGKHLFEIHFISCIFFYLPTFILSILESSTL